MTGPGTTPKGATLLTEILDESCVLLDMTATSKGAAIDSLVDVLVKAEVVTDRDRMIEDIVRREQVMSTGIGGGIAVPHAQSQGATRLALTLGRRVNPSISNRWMNARCGSCSWW